MVCLMLCDILKGLSADLCGVGDSMSKQFSREKDDMMSAFPATVGGMSVDVPVGSVRRALAFSELSCSHTVAITIILELLVSMAQTVACLVGQQPYDAVGQEKMSSDVEPGAGSGNWGGCFGDTSCEPSRSEQVPLVCGPEVGDIYSVGTISASKCRT